MARTALDEALDDPHAVLPVWALAPRHPAQAALLAARITWCSAVADAAAKDGDAGGLGERGR